MIDTKALGPDGIAITRTRLSGATARQNENGDEGGSVENEMTMRRRIMNKKNNPTVAVCDMVIL